MKQTPGAIERFWRVVLVSALDEELARMDARYGIQVFWQAFLATRQGYRIGVPVGTRSGSWYEGAVAEAVIETGAGKSGCAAAVHEIRIKDGAFAGVALEDGTELSADACIVTVPQNALFDLLPAELKNKNVAFEGLANIRTSPITGVHMWFDRVVMDKPFLALLEGVTQWVFNKTALYGKNETNFSGVRPKDKNGNDQNLAGQYLQLVISASYDLVSRSRQDTASSNFRQKENWQVCFQRLGKRSCKRQPSSRKSTQHSRRH